MICPVRKFALTLVAALAVASCSEQPTEPQVKADPPFYEIASPNGEIEGWMLGTVHALPDDTRWRTQAIADVVGRADYLIVEIADLEDRAGVSAIFTRLAASPGHPEIADRIDPEYAPELSSLLTMTQFAGYDFSNTETWAAALMLARAAAQSDPGNGVDRAILADFAGRDVREFEGALAQLSIFDTLPEQDQRDLLDGVLAEVRTLRQRPDRLRDAWLAGDEDELAQITRSGLMADPELYNALLLHRNERWVQQLAKELQGQRRPLVAVGTGHLVGPDSLGAMLETRGYTVRRIGR